jgi:hypothetical protein
LSIALTGSAIDPVSFEQHIAQTLLCQTSQKPAPLNPREACNGIELPQIKTSKSNIHFTAWLYFILAHLLCQ